VIADGEVIASRDTGILATVFRSGWPDPADVVNALHKRADAAGT
jgi:hypothetical protein